MSIPAKISLGYKRSCKKPNTVSDTRKSSRVYYTRDVLTLSVKFARIIWPSTGRLNAHQDWIYSLDSRITSYHPFLLTMLLLVKKEIHSLTREKDWEHCKQCLSTCKSCMKYARFCQKNPKWYALSAETDTSLYVCDQAFCFYIPSRAFTPNANNKAFELHDSLCIPPQS